MNLLTPFMAEFPKSYFYIQHTKAGIVEISAEEFWDGRISGNLETRFAALPTAVHDAIYKENHHA
jgi:hypothetical protein